MSPDRKARWRKEIDWLLSVTDYIVEFVPSQQKSKDGTNMEVEYLSPYHPYLNTKNCIYSFEQRTENCILSCSLIQFMLLTDNGDTTTKRSAHEYPSLAQTRHDAPCKNKKWSVLLTPAWCWFSENISRTCLVFCSLTGK